MDSLKILVVDDEARMRKLVKDFLTIKGFSVIEAEDGEQAVDIFFKQKDISLIILASSVAEDAARAVPKLKHYKSYRMSLYGFSHYRLFVADLSNGNQLCNAQGRSMKKLFGKIMV